MISRTVASSGPTSVCASALGVLACMAAALALSATPALAAEKEKACEGVAEPVRAETERHRQESNINPSTHAPYSTELPDCRAYEMVSPLYKQSNDAGPINGAVAGFPVAPGGETVGFASLGDFAEPENFKVNYNSASNIFLSSRGASGWSTLSAFAPAALLTVPFLDGLDGDSSLDLRSLRLGCGGKSSVNGESTEVGARCVLHKEALPLPEKWEPSSWAATPVYETVDGGSFSVAEEYEGASANLSRVVIQPSSRLLEGDLPGEKYTGGDAALYEIAGVGTASPLLRLVSVNNSGNVMTNPGSTAALLGEWRAAGPTVLGSDYHAISASGETIFFTAESEEDNEIETLYARIHCHVGDPEHPLCNEYPEHSGESFETVPVSDPTPSECTECSPVSSPSTELKSPTFVGASADGSKVFFMTQQRLLSKEPKDEGDPFTTPNLYEYDFSNKPGHKLVLLSPVLSPESEAAGVGGVVSTSSDGSHVYFEAGGLLPKVAGGVLGTEKNEYEEEATSGGKNLYGYDTVTGETKFVAHSGEEAGTENHAQTTPDGRYLVFSAASELAHDTNKGGSVVYRYDFDTGQLTWISHAAPGEANPNEGKNSLSGGPVVARPLRTKIGAYADANDWNRAISGCPAEGEGVPGEELEVKCPKEKYDGETIIFTTSEKLQANATSGVAEVYAWHCPSPCKEPATEGTVGRVSDGAKLEADAMSASGADIFFTTPAQLVAQDTDALADVYDARVDGGFPKPVEPVCPSPAEGGCQGAAKERESFSSAPSSLLPAGGNLSAPVGGSPAPQTAEPKPKPLTRAQQLAKALKACKGKPKKKRATCESQARRKYAAKAKAKAKKSERRGK